ncbi:hypothetical protein Tco_1275317 [Tanacetum coccineum]
MTDKFLMSSMGEPHLLFVDVVVLQDKKGIFISQDIYVHKILKIVQLTDVKSASTSQQIWGKALGSKMKMLMMLILHWSELFTDSDFDGAYLTGSQPLEVVNLREIDIKNLTSPEHQLLVRLPKSLIVDSLLKNYMVLNAPCFYNEALASPEQTATGKDFPNPLIVDSLLKTIWSSMHHVFTMKHWLVYEQRINSMASPKQTAIGKDSSNPFMAGSLPKTILCVNLFLQIIDFITRSHIYYALTKKPEVCVSFIKKIWRSAEALTDGNGDVKINATIDGHSLSITEGSLR